MKDTPGITLTGWMVLPAGRRMVSVSWTGNPDDIPEFLLDGEPAGTTHIGIWSRVLERDEIARLAQVGHQDPDVAGPRDESAVH